QVERSVRERRNDGTTERRNDGTTEPAKINAKGTLRRHLGGFLLLGSTLPSATSPLRLRSSRSSRSPRSPRSPRSSPQLTWVMSISGMIFDVDGTLVDTNPAHVEAWRRAFLKMGHQVPTSRIVLEIGKGGDLLVPSVLGEQAEEREGEALRKRQKEEFLAIARKERFRLFPGAREIFPALRVRGVLTALATSSNDKHLEATLASAGVDPRRLADKVVTKTEDETSKPAPDLIVAAVEELQ